MKVKKIRIKSKEEFNDELRSVARALDQGKIPKKMAGEHFESLDAVRTVLTDKRLELWRTIRDRKPVSISSLAKMVDRNFRGVYRGLQLLQTLQLVCLKKVKGKLCYLRTGCFRFSFPMNSEMLAYGYQFDHLGVW